MMLHMEILNKFISLYWLCITDDNISASSVIPATVTISARVDIFQFESQDNCLWVLNITVKNKVSRHVKKSKTLVTLYLFKSL